MKNSNLTIFYNDLAWTKIKHKRHFFVMKLVDKTKIVSLNRYEEIRRLMKQGKNLLDIGVGEGTFLRIVQPIYDSIYGIDISPVRIRHLMRQRAFLRFHLSVGNIEARTGFRKNYFDAISLVAVLEHVVEPDRALKEISRILKRNGLLYLEVPNIVSIFARLSILFGRFPLTSEDPGFDGGHLHYFDIHNLTQLLTRHGFVVERVSCSGFMSVFRRIFPSLLGADLIVVARKTSA